MFKMNLSLKVLSVFIATGIFSATLVGVVVYKLLIVNALNEINHFHKIIVQQTLDKVDRHIRSSILNVQSAAQEQVFQELLHTDNPNNRNNAYLRLGDLLSLSGPWNILLLTNTEGDYIVTSHRLNSKLNLNDDVNQELVKQALISNDLYVSDLIYSAKTGGLTIIVAAKIIDKKHPKHKALGILIGHLAWPVIEEILQSNLPSNSQFYLYNKNKRLITSTNKNVPRSIFGTMSDDRAAFSHHFIKSGKSIISDSQHKHSTVISNSSKESGYLDYAGNDWLLSIEIEESIVLKTATEESTWLALLVSLLVILVSVLPGIYIHQRVSRPIIRLSNTLASESIPANFTALFQPRNDEIGQLYNSISTMLTAIEKDKNKLVISRDELQEIVAQQTLSINSSEARQQIIFGSALDAIITMDEDGKVVEINPAAEKIFGISNENICGKELIEYIIPPDVREDYRAKFSRYEANDKKNALGKRIEIKAIRANGEEFPAELTIFSYTIGNDLFFTSFLRDITERKLQDEQIRHSQKMDALGKLTGGVAHDFNNILGIILGYSEILQIALSDRPELIKHIKQIVHAGQRGADLISTLQSFSRRKQSNEKIINLNTILQNQRHLLEKTLTVRINLTLILEDDLWPVFFDSGEFEDAIINMSINAMHAIENNGQLTIKTENKNINIQESQILSLEPGEYILLSIIDTGYGMDEVTREKIFDPFFTTKGDKGTGLGLSRVYGFVKRCCGAIQVYSKPGQGSRFLLYFPRSYKTDADTDTQANKLTKTNHLKGTETLLIVDDEKALLSLAEVILNDHGYHIFTASGAKQALIVLENEAIDLVISDVVMPDMDGYQLATYVQQQYPHIKIQMVSGFDDRSYNMADSSIYQNRLKKPYTVDALLSRVRKLLD